MANPHHLRNFHYCLAVLFRWAFLFVTNSIDMKYEAEFTLEGGAYVRADSFEEAEEKAREEAERQYGELIADEMYIKVFLYEE